MTTQRHSRMIAPGESVFRYIRDGDVYEDVRIPGHRVYRWTPRGNVIELRALECPGCESTNTSVTSSPSVRDHGDFQCWDCSAEGIWNMYCKQRHPIHLADHCDCGMYTDIWDEMPKAWPPDARTSVRVGEERAGRHTESSGNS